MTRNETLPEWKKEVKPVGLKVYEEKWAGVRSVDAADYGAKYLSIRLLHHVICSANRFGAEWLCNPPPQTSLSELGKASHAEKAF